MFFTHTDVRFYSYHMNRWPAVFLKSQVVILPLLFAATLFLHGIM